MNLSSTSRQSGDTAPGVRDAAFPATHWSKLLAARADDITERRDALAFLLRRY